MPASLVVGAAETSIARTRRWYSVSGSRSNDVVQLDPADPAAGVDAGRQLVGEVARGDGETAIQSTDLQQCRQARPDTATVIEPFEPLLHQVHGIIPRQALAEEVLEGGLGALAARSAGREGLLARAEESAAGHVELEDPSFALVQVIAHVERHHHQALEMAELVADRTNRPELIDVAGLPTTNHV